MITKFNNYIVESRKSIDELETLTPDQLGKLLRDVVGMDSSDIKYIQDILDVGCPIDARDTWDRTALHVAAWENDIEMVEFLISKGAEVNARNNFGWTALHYAAEWGHLEIVEFLISKGADIQAKDDDGWTAWDYALAIRVEVPELNPNK